MVSRRLLTVVVLVFIAWALVKYQDRVPEDIRDFGAQKQTKVDQDAGISFSYPKGYVLQEPPRGAQEHPDFVKAYVLMPQEDYDTLATFEGTEGPPTITLMVFKNPQGLNASLWIKEPTIAPLIPPQTTVPTTLPVGGNEGIMFGADGLYSSDNVVVVYGDSVLFASGGYMDAQSPMCDVFKGVISSVEFVK